MSLFGLFGRTVAVQIGVEGAISPSIGKLRVGFRVEHKAEKHPSKAQIRIYNPAPSTIGLLQLPRVSVRLLVGYDPLPRLIFQGSPVTDGIGMSTEGPDKILKIEASDGGRAYTSTLINVSFVTPTTFGQVLAAVLLQTQWARGFIGINEAFVFPHGIVLVGTPTDVLDRLAEATPPGADWFIRDNALYMVIRGTATPEVAPLLSSLQGNLIGSPVQTKEGIRCKGLIDSTMRPGRSFVVESTNALVSGLYTARDVTFTGDSGFATPYYMELAAKPLGVP